MQPSCARKGSALTLGIALIVAAPLLALSSGADEDELIAIDVLEAVQVEKLNAAGADVLTSIGAARGALSRRDAIAARRHVMHARYLLGDLAKVSPSVRLHDNIDDALHELAAGNDPDLLPIYEELDAVVEIKELAEVRTHVDKAKGALGGGERSTVEAALVEASAAVVYMEIDLPIHETYARLSRAHMQIRSRNYASADASLREAEEHVQVVVVAAGVEAVEVEAD